MSVLDELRALESAATAAPWATYRVPWYGENQAVALRKRSGILARNNITRISDADLELVAAARNVLPALLDIAEAAQAFLGAGALIVLDGDATSRDAAARAVGELHAALARLRSGAEEAT